MDLDFLFLYLIFVLFQLFLLYTVLWSMIFISCFFICKIKWDFPDLLLKFCNLFLMLLLKFCNRQSFHNILFYLIKAPLIVLGLLTTNWKVIYFYLKIIHSFSYSWLSIYLFVQELYYFFYLWLNFNQFIMTKNSFL